MVQEYVKRQVNANRCSPRYLAVGVSAEAMNMGGEAWYSFKRLAEVEEFVAATREPVKLCVDQRSGYLFLTAGDYPVRHLVRAAAGEVLIFDTSIRRFMVASRPFFARNYTALEGLDEKEGGVHDTDVH